MFHAGRTEFVACLSAKTFKLTSSSSGNDLKCLPANSGEAINTSKGTSLNKSLLVPLDRAHADCHPCGSLTSGRTRICRAK